MSRTIKSILLGSLLCAGFISCQKEYSIENKNGTPISSGTAVYTFDGAPGACLSPGINGTYQVGTAMGAGNTIVLTANVTNAGTYTISTGAVNGVTFSVTSSFSTTGPQIIQLTGSGTPTAAGTFNYTPGTNGCAFSITFAGSGGGITGTSVFTCTSMTSTGTYTQNSTLGSANTLVLQVNVQTAGTYTINSGAIDGFSFSGTGTLATGAQTIILTAAGTPTNAGTVTFGIGTGCTVDITVAAASGGGTDYLRCKINGAATVTNFNTNLSGTKDSPATGYNTLDITGDASANSSFDILLAVMGTLSTGDYTGSFTSTKSSLPTYIDENLVEWSISFTQTNNFKVTITAITANRVTGTFSGTLYPLSGAGSVTISGGEFSLPYQ